MCSALENWRNGFDIVIAVKILGWVLLIGIWSIFVCFALIFGPGPGTGDPPEYFMNP